MTGLQKILKLYGRMDVNGVLWVWDYATNRPRIEKEMTKDEITASEKAKWNGLQWPDEVKEKEKHERWEQMEADERNELKSKKKPTA